jgi:pimeloyl-ACP methyl ester carboxylesterase
MRRAEQILLSLIIGLVALILLTTPSGRAQHNAPVSNQFTTGTAFPRFRPTNIIPEAEQVNLAFTTLPYLDPLLTRQQAREVRGFTLDIYREMEQDSDFHRMGSVMGWAYADLVGADYDVGHYFLYIPHNRPDETLPAVVFLHGSAGNFRSYTWVWSQIAEEQGMVVIAPSFGFGEWQRQGGTESVMRALDDATIVVQNKGVEIDTNRIYLGGISNGGRGVSLVGEQYADRFRGLIFVSPVFMTPSIESPAFSTGWDGRPILVVTGEADQRVSLAYIDGNVGQMQANGADLTYITYPNEDHFLFFARRAEVLADISSWINSAR